MTRHVSQSQGCERQATASHRPTSRPEEVRRFVLDHIHGCSTYGAILQAWCRCAWILVQPFRNRLLAQCNLYWREANNSNMDVFTKHLETVAYHSFVSGSGGCLRVRSLTKHGFSTARRSKMDPSDRVRSDPSCGPTFPGAGSHHVGYMG